MKSTFRMRIHRHHASHSQYTAYRERCPLSRLDLCTNLGHIAGVYSIYLYDAHMLATHNTFCIHLIHCIFNPSCLSCNLFTLVSWYRRPKYLGSWYVLHFFYLVLSYLISSHSFWSSHEEYSVFQTTSSSILPLFFLARLSPASSFSPLSSNKC